MESSLLMITSLCMGTRRYVKPCPTAFEAVRVSGGDTRGDQTRDIAGLSWSSS